MASSVDFKRILERYNQEGKTRGVSIVTFCQQNGVEYSIFERWYRNRNKPRLHPVRIVNEEPAQVAADDAETPVEEAVVVMPSSAESDKSLRFSINIKVSNGLVLHQNNIDYRSMIRLVEKLEGLC